VFTETIKQLLALLGGFTVLIGTLAWLVKSLIAHWMTNSLETHKNTLKAVSDLEIERFKDELRRTAFVRETRFSTLHIEVVKAIIEVSVPLNALREVVMDYLSPAEMDGVTKEEKWKRLGPAYQKFKEVYESNRILLPRNVKQMVDEFTANSSISAQRFATSKRINEQLNRVTDPEGKDHWDIAIEAIEKQIKPAYEALEVEMQRIMGFEEYTKKP